MFLFELNEYTEEYERELDARARAAGEPVQVEREIPGEAPTYDDVLAELGLA